MYNILVADDEERIRTIIKKFADFEGYHVAEAKDGLEAVELSKKNPYDLIILDVMMPELDGFSACKEIRKHSNVPILMLSARGEEFDRIHGFENGADDYVIKPFSPKELMLRIDAIIKRSTAVDSGPEIFEHEGFKVNYTSRSVEIDGMKVALSPKEYELLVYMMKHKNTALSRPEILSKVWGFDFYGDDRTLDTHIKRLRKNLGKYSDLIVTLRGVGYKFEV